jgi:hypothetical protein
VYASRFEAAQIASGAASVVGGAVATAAGAAAISVSGPFALLAVLFGVLRWKAGRLADDPADARYSEPATPEWLAFRDEWVESQQWFLNDVPSSRRLVGVLNGAQAMLGACVTAFERAQGAWEAEAAMQYTFRIAETRVYAAQASQRLGYLAAELRTFAVEIDASRWPQRLSHADVVGPPWPSDPRDLDAEITRFLFRSGIPFAVITHALLQPTGVSPEPPPLSKLCSVLIEAASPRAGGLRHFLRTWRPEPSDFPSRPDGSGHPAKLSQVLWRYPDG